MAPRVLSSLVLHALLIQGSLLACSRSKPSGQTGISLIEGSPSEPADECALTCFTVQVSDASGPLSGALVTASADHQRLEIPAVETDADGLAQICPPQGALPPGAELLTLQSVGVILRVPLEIHPFGWSLGREREPGPPASLDSMPILERPSTPILTPQPDTWFAFQVTDPSLYQDRLLVFSGTETDNGTPEPNAYQFGVAVLEQERVTWVSESPIAEQGDQDWDALGRNAPNLHHDGERFLLYYHGLLTDSGGLAIGRAFSDNGLEYEVDPANPILEPEGEPGDPRDGLVGHPTVLQSDDGFTEMWFAAGMDLDMALSADGGASFTRFCAGPVLRQASERLKSPEVLWHQDRYLMTFARGVDHAYDIYWAESLDGLRWRVSDSPVLARGSSDWDSNGVVNGQILPGDPMRLLFAGVGPGGSGLGIARAIP